VSKSLNKVKIEVWFGGEDVPFNTEFIWNNNIVKWQFHYRTMKSYFKHIPLPHLPM
jgi:hypothetical protein